jgi:threonine dehydratase
VTPAVRVVCAGCGREADPGDPFPAVCGGRVAGDGIDHVMTRRLDLSRVELPADDDPNPFVRYRQGLRAWHVARAAGWSDARFVDLVRELDDAVATIDGSGFRVTPLVRIDGIAAAIGSDPGTVWVKDETGNVSGSHKARHLMGVLLELLVAERTGALPAADPPPLAIASCGNAALAAAVVARAAGRRLDVYVLSTAEPPVVDRLRALGARIEVCERAPGSPAGDPSVARLRAALAAGAIPFTCQGDLDGLAIEGGHTLGWELADAVAGAVGGADAQAGRELSGPARLDRVVVQVGGGALASGVAGGLLEAHAMGRLAAPPRIDTVQTEGGWPLRRAYLRLAARLADAGVAVEPGRPLALASPVVARILEAAARDRGAYMWPWETEPVSVAHGILDDETYDWLAVVRAMLATGGRALVVDEATLCEAELLGGDATGIDADATGTAGLAGLLESARHGDLRPDETVAVLFTGARRTPATAAAVSGGVHAIGDPADPSSPMRPTDRST